MKTMTCHQLGGACDLEFHAETFAEMAELSRKHGTEMFEKGDKAHLEAMAHMKDIMKDPEAVETWFEVKREEFENIFED
jgi:hypothetical protein